jgi:hypothetical protein
MTSFGLPHVRGEGFFGAAAGQSGPALISQLANGQLDFLAFNSTGSLVTSDLVANSVGLPSLVGGGNKNVDSSEPRGGLPFSGARMVHAASGSPRKSFSALSASIRRQWRTVLLRNEPSAILFQIVATHTPYNRAASLGPRGAPMTKGRRFRLLFHSSHPAKR